MKSLEELIPGQSKNESETGKTDSVHVEMVECIIAAHKVVEGVFACLDDEVTKQLVKEFIASPQIRIVEKNIDVQIRLVMDAEGSEDRETALGRVREGMNYWKKLILRRAGAIA